MVIAGKEKEGMHVGHFSGWHTLVCFLGPDIAANPVTELIWMVIAERCPQPLNHSTFYRTCKCAGVSLNRRWDYSLMTWRIIKDNRKNSEVIASGVNTKLGKLWQ